MQENKEAMSADTVMHIEYEEVNREKLYQIAFANLGPNATQEEKQKIRDQYRQFYFATDIYPNSHSLQFFDEILKEIYPTMKMRSNCRAILRAICHVFFRELAQNCFQIQQNNSFSSQIDVQTVSYAFNKMQKQKTRYKSMSHLFN